MTLQKEITKENDDLGFYPVMRHLLRLQKYTDDSVQLFISISNYLIFFASFSTMLESVGLERNMESTLHFVCPTLILASFLVNDVYKVLLRKKHASWFDTKLNTNNNNIFGAVSQSVVWRDRIYAFHYIRGG